MQIQFLKSFEKSLKKLNSPDRIKTGKAVSGLLDAFETSVYPKGLGLKKLGDHFHEIRVTIKIRVLFYVESGVIKLVLVGNHDDIKRSLKTR